MLNEYENNLHSVGFQNYQDNRILIVLLPLAYTVRNRYIPGADRF